MRVIFAVLMAGYAIACVSSALAQDREPINEIVARVNGAIITRAEYVSALRDYKESVEREMPGKSVDQINAEFEKTKSQILDHLIENILLEQKAKELNINVEAEVNQWMTEIARDPLMAKEMQTRGVNVEAVRAKIRKGLLQHHVIQRAVLEPIFQRLTDGDKRDFYEKHKENYITTEGIRLSEVFLPLAGRNADEVEQLARRLVGELRAGKSFAAAVQEYSPPTRGSRSRNGELGTFKPREIKEDIATAISNLKVGEVTEPLRVPDGFQIIRLDDRKPPIVPPYENPEVQEAIGRELTMERAEEARKKYMKKLRSEAVVEIAPAYTSPNQDRQ